MLGIRGGGSALQDAVIAVKKHFSVWHIEQEIALRYGVTSSGAIYE